MIRRNPNAGLFEAIDRAGTFILANLFWVLLALPLVTLPAATAGLFATMTPWSQGKQTEVFQSFFPAMRRYWLKATIIGLLDVAVGGLIVVNFSIFRLMSMSQPIALLSQSVTLFVTLIALMTNLYVWPLLVTVDLPLRELLQTAFRLVFSHPGWSVLMLVMGAGVLAVSAFLPAIVPIMATFSAFALVVSWSSWRVIRRYVVDSDLAQSEVKSS